MVPNNDQVELKHLYDKTFADLKVFLEEKETWRDYSLEQFREKVKLFSGISDIWRKAWEWKIYSEEKLNQDFELLRIFSKRLLL